MERQTMEQSEQINEIATALAAAQLKIEGAAKDSFNPHFRSNYSDLASVWDACHRPCNENGIAIVQRVAFREGMTVLVTQLMHRSGQWLSQEYPLVPTKNDPQGFGSAVTYARRYSLMAMVGVAARDDDDDGNAASGRQALNAPQQPAPRGPVRFSEIADGADAFPADVAAIRRELSEFSGKKFSEIPDAKLAAVERIVVELTGKAMNENKVVLATLAALLRNEIGRRVKGDQQ